MNTRLYKYMEEENMDALFVCRPDTVTYLTGFDTPNSFHSIDNMTNGSFSYALADLTSKASTLIVTNLCSSSVISHQIFAKNILYFDTFDFFIKKNYPDILADTLMQAISTLPMHVKRIGVEITACPLIALKAIRKVFPKAELINASPMLEKARMVNQDWEIERMRRAATVADAGQQKLIEIARDFKPQSELQTFSQLYGSMCEAAGKRISIASDYATGKRIGKAAEVVGPRPYVTQCGDMGIFDVSTRIDGYWCDCTNTLAFGASFTPEQQNVFDIIFETYQQAVSLLKPGNTIRQVDEAASKCLAHYGINAVAYTGHLIGTHVNEPPRFVCYDPDTLLQAGMCVCLEPQTYNMAIEAGARLEKVLLVKENGAEELNKFKFGN